MTKNTGLNPIPSKTTLSQTLKELKISVSQMKLRTQSRELEESHGHFLQNF